MPLSNCYFLKITFPSSRVSIPNWFDLKGFLNQTGSIKRLSSAASTFENRLAIASQLWIGAFLFQTGSIKRVCENCIYIIECPYGPRQVNFSVLRFQG